MNSRTLAFNADDPDREARDARRMQLAPGYAAGVTEEMIERLVHAFYAKVRQDAELGPIFDSRIEDWPAHLAKLCDFWSSVTLMTGRFKGAPMRAHVQIDGISEAHFLRWLGLWQETAEALCPPAAATLFVAKSRMIAQSLQLGIAAYRQAAPPR
jgi:hemoglobin